MAASKKSFVPPSNFKGAFGGSGQAVMGFKDVQDEIMLLTEKEPQDIFVVYLGTATYDTPGPFVNQTRHFAAAGATVVHFKVATETPTKDEVQEIFSKADVVMVSGGNTLYAVDRWVKFGIDQAIREAMSRGAVLAGGSAGAICWFDGGHSDSMDPTTYLIPQPPTKDWEYIRVDGLKLLPGLLCPHIDRIQSNGVLRAKDFDQMLLRHKGEHGIGIDHYAVLIIDGEDFRVMSFDDDSGSVCTKEVEEDGSITTKVLPPKGKSADILKIATEIVQDPKVEICRQQNKS
eukprot:TRINITY_DN2475_c0_g1_i1.p1 TRINITY_DN2475_c0_g1~~TRINITY_DN2475_c0_g1_i1.p1  ORF type:complete len:302 (-),score=80.60 TRINITY_DN2475_c0_g1_i1:37-903(-)